MSDYIEWLQRLQEDEAAYYLCGDRPPDGHPDAFAEEAEHAAREGRYFDAPLRAPERRDDGWLDADDLGVAA